MSSVSRRRVVAVVWAAVGGVVLLTALAAVLLAQAVPSQGEDATTRPPRSGGAVTPTPSAPAGSGAGVVDASAEDRGLVPEPITRDVEVYARAALEAAGTFDTTQVTREEFVDYLGTWISGPPHRAFAETRAEAADAARRAVGTGVIVPVWGWEALEHAFGTSRAEVVGELEVEPYQHHYDGDGLIRNVAADVVVTYTHKDGVDGTAGETSYQERMRVQVQVLCEADTEPTPGTAQQIGDCKVLKWIGQGD